MIVAPRHLLTLLAAIALLSLTSCHKRGGFQNQDDGSVTTPLQLPFQNLPAGMIGTPLNTSVVAIGGQKPYSYEFVPGGTSTLDAALQVLPTGFIFGTPSVARIYKPIIRVRDSLGNTAEQQFNLQIQDLTGTVPNVPPEFKVVPAPVDTVHESFTQFTYDFNAIDPDGDPVQYNFISIAARDGSPATGGQPQIDASGKFTWDQMPDNTYDLVINATDGQNSPTVYRFCIVTYTPPATPPLPCNQPPSITVPQYGNAVQGQAFSFQGTIIDPENDVINWAPPILPGTGNIATTLTVSKVAGNPQAYQVDWTPGFNKTPGNYPVTIRAIDSSGNMADAQFVIQLVAGPPQPSDVRVWASGFLRPTGTTIASQSEVRGIEEVDPAIPDMHSFTINGTPDMLDNVAFGYGSSSLALTGPKHNLRIGAQFPREARLGTVGAYIQLPEYKYSVATTTDTATGRIYHAADMETGSTTGTQDTIFVTNTRGELKIFEFPVNIMEEIYVPHHFSELPYFVVTADDGLRMWICRLDGQTFSGLGAQMEFNMANIGTDPVQHQTVTGTLDRNSAGAAAIDFSHLNLWFAVDGGHASTSDRLFRIAGDTTGPGMAPSATLVNLSAQGTPPSGISTYFCPSGDSRRVAMVGGVEMIPNSAGTLTTTILTVDDNANLGAWRDVWMLDGEGLLARRVTDFENNRPASGPDFRLIECFDGSSTYDDNFSNAQSNQDLGGNDRRVMFAENTSTANGSSVGITVNYEGTVCAFVVHEHNEGNGDGMNANKHDEVYVAGMESSSLHDVIRITSSTLPLVDVMGDAGERCEGNSRFNPNYGTCMGLSFPRVAPSAGRGERLFFCYGMYTSGHLGELGNMIYSAEVQAMGTNDIFHVSTVCRTNGEPMGPTGFEIPMSNEIYRMIIGSAEGGDDFGDIDPANDKGMYTFLMFEGSNAPDETATLNYVDNSLPNSAVSPLSAGTLLSHYLDNDNNPISVFRRLDERTHFSSGRLASTTASDFAPPTPNPRPFSLRRPITANLFADVPGPVAAGANYAKRRAFVAVELDPVNAPSVETLFAFDMAVPGIPVVDIGNIPIGGKIHEIMTHYDGNSVAFMKSLSITAAANERFGVTNQMADIFIIPDVDWAMSENAVPTMKNYNASSAGTSALGSFVSRGGVWVDTSSYSGANSREFWFGVGDSTQNNDISNNTQLHAYRIDAALAVGAAPVVGAASRIDPSIMAVDRGSIQFYGSGVR